ncbi:hypothetical protein GV794_01790 [Nocardia cyriacigeorgica]|uniref:Uncharacterized protein n=2 Tax=Nocardia cyriacigeorgica TaxID=135487 RepID=A0ABX0CED7_9NOCA|nr:hypothetical protein [Nocardia cyriacigeorgica]NEW40755.1 hypothetical protein [Nocardia cyriacigeorgica]NEW51017.1 hypothetical protein [Nocardia cyriacigeorgica]NEW54399.1 hypothetical protein [Nocardia cyriacigeorgica]
MAVIVIADLTNDEVLATTRRTIHVDLCDPTSEVVKIPSSDGGGRTVQVEVEMGIDPSSVDRPGIQRMCAVVNLGPGIPLPPGEYRWVVTIDGSDTQAEATFFAID